MKNNLKNTGKVSTLFIISFCLCLTFFYGCKQDDKLDSKHYFCESKINGISYNDFSTLRELSEEEVSYPFSANERITVNNKKAIAHLQFKLGNENNKEDSCQLYGGIAFPKGEKFPLLNKEYTINYNHDFETDKLSDLIEYDYLYNQRKKALGTLPIGLILLKYKDKNGEWMEHEISLKGKLIFKSYNSKNHKYKGSFRLHRDSYEGDEREFKISGEFNVNIAQVDL